MSIFTPGKDWIASLLKTAGEFMGSQFAGCCEDPFLHCQKRFSDPEKGSGQHSLNR
jgi:hypothetical protein